MSVAGANCPYPNALSLKNDPNPPAIKPTIGPPVIAAIYTPVSPMLKNPVVSGMYRLKTTVNMKTITVIIAEYEIKRVVFLITISLIFIFHQMVMTIWGYNNFIKC